jgi:hypothetical protein
VFLLYYSNVSLGLGSSKSGSKQCQLTLSGDFTQNPRSREFERNGDFSLIDY